mgnify:CR=1 FL=1
MKEKEEIENSNKKKTESEKGNQHQISNEKGIPDIPEVLNSSIEKEQINDISLSDNGNTPEQRVYTKTTPQGKKRKKVDLKTICWFLFLILCTGRGRPAGGEVQNQEGAHQISSFLKNLHSWLDFFCTVNIEKISDQRRPQPNFWRHDQYEVLDYQELSPGLFCL